jgi:hypothetical protein
MSNRAHQESLAVLIEQLATYGTLLPLPPASSGKTRLACRVEEVEVGVLQAKVADLVRMLSQMALALELDQ